MKSKAEKKREKTAKRTEDLPKRRRTTVKVTVRIDVARVVVAAGLAAALIIAAANRMPLPHLWPW